jgi:hypothetical protein
MLLFTPENNVAIRGAIGLNGFAVVAAIAELAVKWYLQTGLAVSSQGTFAKAPPEAIQQFLTSQ